jgi:GMP synthase (glutamine-hydrolysing)
MTGNTIVILDFGSQYTQLITRAVRELEVYSVQLPWDSSLEIIEELDPIGIILSGGPDSIYNSDAPRIQSALFGLNKPLLGICYGMQSLADELGGEIQAAPSREYGATQLQVLENNPLIPDGSHTVWMSHGDRITALPEGFQVLASTENTPVAAMGNINKDLYGVQFHPEVKHTPMGMQIIRNFLFTICEAEPTWTPESIVQESVTRIRSMVGEAKVISAVSGGVDSSVATVLVHKAVGNNLEAVFVDTGLLRKNEAEMVESALHAALSIKLHTVQASDQFFGALVGVTDPEEKRRIIGQRFIRVFEEKAQALDKPEFLVQGTIYPDVVESAAPDRAATDTIKTHHNVGGLPERMDFKLIEPLRYLFKDEVRKIGQEIGLPGDLLERQPFPGPGLAIRCLGEVTEDRIKRLRDADAIYLEELAKHNYLVFDKTDQGQGTGSSQAFAVLLPVKTVGVMGDQRTYQDVIALRAVTTDDFMTADWSRFPPDILALISNRIVNEVPGVNRVVFDITSKPPATIEWE